MCLGTIAQVVEVHKDGRAVVEDHGKRQLVLEMTVSDDDITPGDWVVIQSGFALERISEKEAMEANAIRDSAAPAPAAPAPAAPGEEGQPT